MFDIFKKKKYYSCDFLNNELAFFTDRITSCCSGYDGIKYTKNILAKGKSNEAS